MPIPQDIFNKAIITRAGYDRIVIDTREALAMYYGGQALYEFIDSFSVREDPVKLQWRKNTAIDNYENYTQEISDQYIEALKKAGEIERTIGDKKDTDENHYLDTKYREWFDKEFAAMSLICPELYTQVSLPKLEDDEVAGMISKADEKEYELAPYPCIVFPQYVQNLCLDNDGNVEWISIREEYFWTNPQNNQPITYYRFYVYDDTMVYQLEADGHNVYNLVDEKPHGFLQCPFVRTTWKENKWVIGEVKPGQSMMYSIIKKSKGALAFMSMMLENIHFHLFPKLVMGEGTYKNVLENGIGASQTIVEGADATDKADGATRYVETSTKEIELLDQIVHERIPTIIYRRARLRDRSTEKTQSGFSKAFDMVPEVAVLTEISDFYQKSDMKIVELIAEGFQLQEQAIELDYPKTFNVKTTAEVLQEVANFTLTMDKSSLPQSKTANEEIAFRMYKQLIPDKADEWYDEIETEIETYEEPKPTVAPFNTLKLSQVPPLPNGNKIPDSVSAAE